MFRQPESRLIVDRVNVNDANEQLVLEVNNQGDPLTPGQRYTIRFADYTGLINEDLRGLYRSTYRDSDGNQRSVADLLGTNGVVVPHLVKLYPLDLFVIS